MTDGNSFAKHSRLLAAVLAFAVTTAASAADPTRWKAEASAGYLRTSGNSDTQSLNGKFELRHKADPIRQRFLVTATNTSDSGVQTGERYTAGYKLDYDFTKHDYLFGALDYERDLFGGVARRTTATTGYGRRILDGEVHALDLELGVGWRHQEDALGVDEEDAVARLSGEYRWTISDSSRFSQTLRVESGDTNTFTESVSSLKLTIAGNLYAGIGYTLRSNTQVPAGTERTDTELLVNLGYSFTF